MKWYFCWTAAPRGFAKLFFINHKPNLQRSKPSESGLYPPACPTWGFYLIDVCAVGAIAWITQGTGSAAEASASLGAGHAREAGVWKASVKLCHGDDRACGLGVHAWRTRGMLEQSCHHQGLASGGPTVPEGISVLHTQDNSSHPF